MCESNVILPGYVKNKARQRHDLTIIAKSTDSPVIEIV